MNNALLLVLLFLAVAAGWTLGRGSIRSNAEAVAQLPSQYYRGFNFLLDGEQQGAIDAFTEALAVNEDTLDTHIALGSVLRKRGEVDRAIRIHQNLLTRPHLQESCPQFAAQCWTRGVRPEEAFLYPPIAQWFVAALAAVDTLVAATRRAVADSDDFGASPLC